MDNWSFNSAPPAGIVHLFGVGAAFISKRNVPVLSSSEVIPNDICPFIIQRVAPVNGLLSVFHEFPKDGIKIYVQCVIYTYTLFVC